MAKPVSIRADTKDIRAVLAKHSEFVQKTVPEMVRAHARLCAVQLALRTAPFSVGSKEASARKGGETTIRNDFKKVMNTKADLHMYIENMSSDSLREKLKKMMFDGKWAALIKLSNKLGLASGIGGIEMVKGAGLRAIHEKHRDKRTGRVSKKPDKYYVASVDTEGYIKKRLKRVGMSKGGWAQCARLVGNLKAGKNGKAADNARGIPQWVKRHKHGGEVKDKTNNTKNPHVIMTNTIPWISNICNKADQKIAVRVATEMMFESFQKALKAAAKKNAKDNKAQAEPKSA